MVSSRSLNSEVPLAARGVAEEGVLVALPRVPVRVPAGLLVGDLVLEAPPAEEFFANPHRRELPSRASTRPSIGMWPSERGPEVHGDDGGARRRVENAGGVVLDHELSSFRRAVGGGNERRQIVRPRHVNGREVADAALPRPEKKIARRLVRDRRGNVGIELDRKEARLDELVPLPHRSQETRSRTSRRSPDRNEIAETVRDELALVPLQSLQRVRVVADHDVRAGIDGGACLLVLILGREVGVLRALVELNDEKVRLGPGEP